eukprot:jgi/Chrzof1/5757/Cz16g14210.t1
MHQQPCCASEPAVHALLAGKPSTQPAQQQLQQHQQQSGIGKTLKGLFSICSGGSSNATAPSNSRPMVFSSHTRGFGSSFFPPGNQYGRRDEDEERLRLEQEQEMERSNEGQQMLQGGAYAQSACAMANGLDQDIQQQDGESAGNQNGVDLQNLDNLRIQDEAVDLDDMQGSNEGDGEGGGDEMVDQMIGNGDGGGGDYGGGGGDYGGGGGDYGGGGDSGGYDGGGGGGGGDSGGYDGGGGGGGNDD